MLSLVLSQDILPRCKVTALVFLDAVIASLMVKLGRKEEELKARHD